MSLNQLLKPNTVNNSNTAVSSKRHFFFAPHTVTYFWLLGKVYRISLEMFPTMYKIKQLEPARLACTKTHSNK